MNPVPGAAPGPAGPSGPVSPTGPWEPAGPCAPASPCDPAGPCGPVSPTSPCGPAGPCRPVSPAGPGGPCGPCFPSAPSFPFEPSDDFEQATAVTIVRMRAIRMLHLYQGGSSGRDGFLPWVPPVSPSRGSSHSLPPEGFPLPRRQRRVPGGDGVGRSLPREPAACLAYSVDGACERLHRVLWAPGHRLRADDAQEGVLGSP